MVVEATRISLDPRALGKTLLTTVHFRGSSF